MSITSTSWIESTESHVIVDGGVTVCLLLSAHRAVIFAIAQLSCLCYILSCNASTTARREPLPQISSHLHKVPSIRCLRCKALYKFVIDWFDWCSYVAWSVCVLVTGVSQANGSTDGDSVWPEEPCISFVLCLHKPCYIRQVNGVNGEIYCDAFFLLSVCLWTLSI